MIIHPVRRLRGEITVPGDKSISHRSIMLGALAKGTTTVTHFLEGADCLSSIECFRALGVSVENDRYKKLSVSRAGGFTVSRLQNKPWMPATAAPPPV